MTGKFRRCIFCFELILETAPAIISPWIRELGVQKWSSTYQKCDYCDLGFFSYRYGPVEMGLIYGKYRSNEYTKIRNRWEPWYSKAYNANHDSKDWVESRKLAIENFIYGLTQTDNLRIADIGGDKGQFIPNFASLKYVVELSNKVPDPGIVRVDSLSDLPEVDLIIYAHVLEHVSDPIGEVLTLFTKARQIYISRSHGEFLN